MAPAAEISILISSLLKERLFRALAAASCTANVLLAPSSATRGTMAPAATSLALFALSGLSGPGSAMSAMTLIASKAVSLLSS